MRQVIRTSDDWDALAKRVAAMKTPLTVSIMEGAHRSTEQNKLQRKWCHEVAEQLGDRTPEEVRGYSKLHFGVPILREDAAFQAEYDALIKPLPYEAKLRLMMEPFDFGVTRKMTTKQKTAYLDAMFKHWSEMGVKLTQPEDTGGDHVR